ncbi:hypothetical protein NKH47_17690 [Mesorhizobium sp. M1060]|uniref:sunset domain-containing protein n=1 Tax=unclassified Mesorhizobium TaxID=325217 RepID=UPI0003CE6B31|nr:MULTISPECIES: hypothetical protein [unclassified Mesorhizobium]ESX13496.1 hypothetical protein X768_04460 [Mesorhizobium sp. LSJC265A00]ESX44967.1 hypothetical protein X764_03820 [Mesorhizobium sp. LSHC440A00]ESZ15590.1 hypothetical protein X735_01270 [Mesorhizobium sp. L2C085B000]WJI59276.1 hypothetical protein NLY33_11440 [Mesorhizobium sp. C432A]
MGLQRQKPVRRRRRSLLDQRALIPVLLCGVAGASYFMPQAELHPLPTVHRQGDSPASRAPAGCNIKGNISVETGERIYHMPGQRYYNTTVVNPAKGERWFCSQWQAWWAGWRKAKV